MSKKPQTKASVGKVEATGYGVGPSKIDASYGIGPVEIDPQQGAQPSSQTPTAVTMDGTAVVPFALFYRVTQGNPELAEKIVPGITKPDGYRQLQAGPDGRPLVPLKTVNAMAQFDLMHRKHGTGARGKPDVPEFVPLDQAQLTEENFPGISNQGGYLPYLKRDPQSGQMLMRNPQHPGTQAQVQQHAPKVEGARRKMAAAMTVASDDE